MLNLFWSAPLVCAEACGCLMMDTIYDGVVLHVRERGE